MKNKGTLIFMKINSDTQSSEKNDYLPREMQ